ncbi:hypothetical protein BH18VER1_BH18VER1_21830 [soil metagenome]
MSQHPRIPSSTYRLQFNREFTFSQAREIVPYLHELGISDCYASPYFQARAESLHGYDITDHNKLNAAIGSRAEYDAFVAELHARGMGQVLDFVPNHMGIGEPLNLWWQDVLENGPSSSYARYFDIDWRPLKADLHDKVLLPILGDQYGRVLEAGELKVRFEGGAFHLNYYEHDGRSRLALTGTFSRSHSIFSSRIATKISTPSSKASSPHSITSRVGAKPIPPGSLSERERRKSSSGGSTGAAAKHRKCGMRSMRRSCASTANPVTRGVSTRWISF